ncbi:hypothetical protein GQR58_023848 [Nymphon striatum]|nr:hypothetical protein GQR58_023848 [Nymphon striatum]
MQAELNSTDFVFILIFPQGSQKHSGAQVVVFLLFSTSCASCLILDLSQQSEYGVDNMEHRTFNSKIKQITEPTKKQKTFFCGGIWGVHSLSMTALSKPEKLGTHHKNVVLVLWEHTAASMKRTFISADSASQKINGKLYYGNFQEINALTKVEMQFIEASQPLLGNKEACLEDTF